jgi:hypothetical protein
VGDPAPWINVLHGNTCRASHYTKGADQPNLRMLI